MASPFLVSFSESVVKRLIELEHLDIEPGSGAAVVAFVAERLGAAQQGDSLVSSFVTALLACPQVDELYVDNETVKDLITDLPASILPRGPS